MNDITAEIVASVGRLSRRSTWTDRAIVAVAMVRDEADIIERFVRHTLSWADFLLIVDHASCDDTSLILRQLDQEGLSLCVIRDDALGKHQSDRMTLLARTAAELLDAHVIVPIDGDEFLVCERHKQPKEHLRALSSNAAISAHWRNYVPTPSDDFSERDVVKRIGWRLEGAHPGVTKVIIGAEVARQTDFRLGYGSHWLHAGGHELSPKTISSLYFAHFPVRSAGQITAKVLLTPLVGMIDRERPTSAQEHYGWLRSLVPIHSHMSAQDLQSAAEQYGFHENQMESPMLVYDPIPDTSGALRYTSTDTVDAALRLERFARRVLQSELEKLPTALRKLIVEENAVLRTQRDQAFAVRDEVLKRNGYLEAEFEKIMGARSVRLAIKIRRLIKRFGLT